MKPANNGTSSVLLPLRLFSDAAGRNDFGYHNGAVLCVGGHDLVFSPQEMTVPRQQIDAFDPLGGASGTGAWTASAQLSIGRACPMAVILPDGRITVIGGSDTTAQASNPIVKKAEYVTMSPGGPGGLNLAVEQGQDSMADFRAYHTIAVLLTDGRILVAGGRPGGSDNDPFERATYTILSPDYISPTKPRPSIAFVSNKVLNRKNDPSAPTNPVLTTNLSVSAQTTSSPTAFEAVLISLGSMTHAFDMNQRYVQLEISNAQQQFPTPVGVEAWSLTLEAPEYRWAPPGFYMLFIVNQDGIPSTAAMIRLE